MGTRVIFASLPFASTILDTALGFTHSCTVALPFAPRTLSSFEILDISAPLTMGEEPLLPWLSEEGLAEAEGLSRESLLAEADG